LREPWILDVDTTVKPLYGHQEGAVVGYNPKKPGRPSHTYHSYMLANLRLVLEVEVPGLSCHQLVRHLSDQRGRIEDEGCDKQVPDDWVHAERWPPPGTSPQRLYRGSGSGQSCIAHLK